VRKITSDVDAIESVIRSASVCRIALSDDGQPYVVPVCFGYADNTLYFHSAPRGRKLDILAKNNAVCCEFDVDQEIVRAEDACAWSVRYRSVVAFGWASIVKDLEEKRKALDVIVAHYGGRPCAYPEATLLRTTVVKVEIQSMTAKISSKFSTFL
jgi:nitroimidazol reductase NimA-like FMN-containing flavoprotein (pyridoxamine 5'-phosphate oxidase superfamily)